MPNSKPPYPPEFRAEAVRLARSPGHSVVQVASRTHRAGAGLLTRPEVIS